MSEDKKSEKSAALEAAELRKAQAEAAVAELEVVEKKLAVKKAKRDAKKRRRQEEFEWADDHSYTHGVYRFVTGVSGSSVYACKDWLKTMQKHSPEQELRIEFNSGGGSVLDGLELFDAIREASAAGHHITTYIGGVAASMAGILAQAGDTRQIGAHSWLHAHEVSTGASGKSSDLKDTAELADRLTRQAADIYAERSTNPKMTSDKVFKMLERQEVWLTPEEALKHGFVDEIV